MISRFATAGSERCCGQIPSLPPVFRPKFNDKAQDVLQEMNSSQNSAHQENSTRRLDCNLPDLPLPDLPRRESSERIALVRRDISSSSSDSQCRNELEEIIDPSGGTATKKEFLLLPPRDISNGRVHMLHEKRENSRGRPRKKSKSCDSLLLFGSLRRPVPVFPLRENSLPAASIGNDGVQSSRSTSTTIDVGRTAKDNVSLRKHDDVELKEFRVHANLFLPIHESTMDESSDEDEDLAAPRTKGKRVNSFIS